MKIVGIILLVILALILFVIISFLFVPVKYQIAAFAHAKKYKGEAHANWFFHLFHISFYYEEELTGEYGYLWVKKDPFSKVESDQEESIDEDMQGNASTEEKTNDGPYSQSNTSVSKGNVESDSSHTNENSGATNSTEKESKRRSIKRKWNHFKHNFKKFKHIIEDERNQTAVSHLKEELIRLLIAICPKKMKLNADFSTGSPDTTGQVLGLIACFPLMYQNKWKIHPDFEADSFYIEGETEIIGKIYLYKIIGIAFRVWRDKNCRRLYHQLSK